MTDGEATNKIRVSRAHEEITGNKVRPDIGGDRGKQCFRGLGDYGILHFRLRDFNGTDEINKLFDIKQGFFYIQS